MKLKTDGFSVSTISLLGCLRWKLPVVCFVDRVLYSQAHLKESAKQLSRLNLGL